VLLSSTRCSAPRVDAQCAVQVAGAQPERETGSARGADDVVTQRSPSDSQPSAAPAAEGGASSGLFSERATASNGGSADGASAGEGAFSWRHDKLLNVAS